PVQSPSAVPSKQPPSSKPIGQQIRITCPACKGQMTLKAGSAPPFGKTIKCPRCTKLFRVRGPVAKPPTTPASQPARYTCPGCAVTLKTKAALPARTMIHCPRCKRAFFVPSLEQLVAKTNAKLPVASPTQQKRDTKLLLPPKIEPATSIRPTIPT